MENKLNLTPSLVKEDTVTETYSSTRFVVISLKGKYLRLLQGGRSESCRFSWTSKLDKALTFSKPGKLQRLPGVDVTEGHFIQVTSSSQVTITVAENTPKLSEVKLRRKTKLTPVVDEQVEE